MELQELKDLWKLDVSSRKSPEEIRKMITVAQHPVLRRIRKQVAIEALAWAVLLLLMYSAFDANQKPLWVVLVLVIPLVVSIVHHVMGYISMVTAPAGDVPLAVSLNLSYRHMRRFVWTDKLLRLLLMIAFLVFFTYGIDFTPGKYVILAGILAIFAGIQIVNAKLWNSRLKRLCHTIDAMGEK